VISRPDLAGRTIFLTLPPIGEPQRRPEAELWREFEIARPSILGVLLDAAAHGLRMLAGSDCRPRALPRMADFTLWATACEQQQKKRTQMMCSPPYGAYSRSRVTPP
jgi:hypothetical protein